MFGERLNRTPENRYIRKGRHLAMATLWGSGGKLITTWERHCGVWTFCPGLNDVAVTPP
jgi:hypothetical protein